VRERIEYRFRVLSEAVFTLYSYSKALEYSLEYPIVCSLIKYEQMRVLENSDWQANASLLGPSFSILETKCPSPASFDIAARNGV
jgi:hypothetical protein